MLLQQLSLSFSARSTSKDVRRRRRRTRAQRRSPFNRVLTREPRVWKNCQFKFSSNLSALSFVGVVSIHNLGQHCGKVDRRATKIEEEDDPIQNDKKPKTNSVSCCPHHPSLLPSPISCTLVECICSCVLEIV